MPDRGQLCAIPFFFIDLPATHGCAGWQNLVLVHSLQCFILALTQARFIFDVLLGSAVAFTASIGLHPRSLRACAEPRRESARHVEDPLVYVI